MKPKNHEPLILLVIAGVCLIISGINPYDRTVWVLEVFPLFIGAPILIATYNRFPLTPLVYRLLLIHAVILILGSHYTYARVPLGLWIQDIFDLSRNHYDRLGHLAQGFIPAILAREILLRWSPLDRGKWLFFLVVSVCVAFSALYELIEWWAAIVGGEAASGFLGAQGDIWDSHWDMFFALIGAVIALITLSRCHDRALKEYI